MKKTSSLIVRLCVIFTALLISAIMIISCNGDKSVLNDYSELRESQENDSGIEPLPFETVLSPDTEILISTDTEGKEPDTEDEPEETEAPTEMEKSQLALDLASKEIAEAAEVAVPLYKTADETDEGGNIISEGEEYYPQFAYYYMDMSSGLTMSYNADKVFYTASIIKAPYVMWVLMQIEEAEKNGSTEGSIYDLGSIFVYTEDKYRTGSGVIQFEEYGTEYTYLDLLKLSVTESDNVAFAELRNIYGKKGFNDFSKSIGVENTAKNLYRASASEMGAYLKAIYEYFESESKYAAMLLSWMLSTNHRVIIPSAVKPVQAANKYGWDIGAYHDIAVVFDEDPYILVIMTELDGGRKTENSFIHSIVKSITDLHREIMPELR